MKTSDGQPQYLTFVSYNTYDHGWSITGVGGKFQIPANNVLSTGAGATHTVTQNIEVVTPPSEEQPYLIGASDVVQMSLVGMFWMVMEGLFPG